MRRWWKGQWGGCEHCGTRQERSSLLLNGPGLGCSQCCCPSTNKPFASRHVIRTVARKSSTRGLYVRAGGVDIQIWQNFRWFIVFQISIWGGLKLCLGGLSPPKLPRGDGTAYHLRPVDYLKFSLRKNESRVIVFQKYEWLHCWDGTTCSAGTIRIKDWQHYKDFSSYWTTSRSSLQVMFMITEPWFKSSAATSFRN